MKVGRFLRSRVIQQTVQGWSRSRPGHVIAPGASINSPVIARHLGLDS